MPADGGDINLKARAHVDATPVEERPAAARAEALRQAAEQRRRERRRRLRWALYLLLPLLLILAGYFYVTGGRYMTSDDAYIEADTVAVAADVSGLVQRINVRQNQHVAAGQPLFTLDPAPFRYAVAQAEANLANVRDQITALRADYSNLDAEIVQAQDQLAYAQRNLARAAALARQQYAPQTALDQARLQVQTTEQTLTSLKAQQAAVVAKLDGKPTIPVAMHPLYFTVKEPFIKPALFRDRNFTAGIVFVAIVGLILYAPLSLLPPYMQDLMNYPVFTAGIAMAPRGVGTMLAMVITGRLTGKIDTRILLAAGLGLMAWALYAMTGWTPAVSMATVMVNGIVQGAGLGLLFVPLSTVIFATLPAQYRTDGTGIYTYVRNIGSSIGISIVQALLVSETQINHATVGHTVTPFNRLFEHGAIAHYLSPYTAAGRALLDSVISQQALIIAYIDDFKLVMIVSLMALPLLLLFRRPPKDGAKPGMPGLE